MLWRPGCSHLYRSSVLLAFFFFFLQSLAQSPKIAICMNKPCTCCASHLFSSTSTLERRGSSLGLCLRRSVRMSLTHFSQSSQHFFCSITFFIFFLIAQESISTHHSLFAGFYIFASHPPPALMLCLSHVPTSISLSHVRTMTGAKWLPRQQWWTSARSQEKKMNPSNLMSKSWTCL